ncbi:hypothetical protein BX600DRAFT_485070 [Xylariales sp. PMI_506]|nr:hypothetical protein BX600DRAFT_485070 [Xylariales sp. PMI_506]
MLTRAGYLRQSQPGIFHMLPMGQRVQEKLERLIDKYMSQLGASKISLSSLSTQELWEKTNRLEGYGPELFRFHDRKDVPYLLAPTHEEEITTLVSKLALPRRYFPLRVYQIGRKYRDEIRPRHGLLRSREFLMKDLYTFDATVQAALETYGEVRAAYSRLFNELKLPYLVAEASSGDIGGDLSHEYHLPSPVGEDNVISCGTCSYVANEELAIAKPRTYDEVKTQPLQGWFGITKDRSTLVCVWHRAPDEKSSSSINAYAVKSLVPELDSGVESPLSLWKSQLISSSGERSQTRKILHLFDQTAGPDSTSHTLDSITSSSQPPEVVNSGASTEIVSVAPDGQPLSLLRIHEGDGCAHCNSGTLKIQKAVELGHTFHLGTRYSEPLGAKVHNEDNTPVPLQMGCHGIGVSRIIAAVAGHLADSKGLNWPRAIAPYEVAVIFGPNIGEADTHAVYDQLTGQTSWTSSGALDVVLDDRPESFAWKLRDADVVGYPVLVLLGRRWASEKICEVQCRRLSVKEEVPFDKLHEFVQDILSQL